MNDAPRLAQRTADSGVSSTFYERTWRWWVLGTLFFATFLNYLARATLSGTADPICAEFGLDQAQRGQLLAAFVYAYATAHLFIGFLLDRVRNVRWVFPVFVLGWSATNMLVRWAGSYSAVYGLQTVLGIWESANFPICLMLISRLFPPQERAFASGVFYSGAVLANLLAAKFVIHLATAMNWRWAFFITGSLGFLWVVPWLLIFRHPERRALFWPAASEPSAIESVPLGEVLRRPAFWGVALTGMGIIPGLYFVTQWLPSYLTNAWHVPYSQALGNRLALIAFFQDLGMWLGGGAVWLLAQRGGFSTLASRKMIIVCAYVLMLSVLLLPRASSVNAGLAVLCVYIFGLGAWLANQQAFKQEVARGRVATVAGLVGFAETVVSAFLVQRVGTIVQSTGGFNAVFVLFGLLFTAALAMVFLFMRPKWLKPG